MDSDYTELQESTSWRKNYGFLNFFYVNIFFACVSFSIVMPSIWKYIEREGGDEYFLALVLLIYSLGEFAGSLFFGYLHNYCTTKSSFLNCIGTGFLGSVFYFLADYVGDGGGLWLIFVGRMLQGLWTGGQQAIEQSYVSEVVTDKHKLKVLSELGIFVVLGFVLGPVFGILLSMVDLHLASGLKLDAYTAPGYLQAVLTFLMMVMTNFWFQEVPHFKRPGRQQETKKPNVPPPKPLGVTVCLVLCFIIFNGFAVQETITTPLVTDSAHKYTESFDWNVTAAYGLFAGSGVISIITFAAIHLWGHVLKERTLLELGLLLGGVGWLLLIDYQRRHINLPMFFVGYVLISMSFPIGRNVVFTMLSKILGPCRAGGYMGWMLAVGAVARMLGPFWAVQSLTFSIKLGFGVTAGLFFIGMLLLGCFWKQCRPHPSQKKL